MQGFALDSSGDILIENNRIQMVTGDSLTQQKVRNVLSTNLREWFLNWDEGINQRNMMGKNTNEELIRYEIEMGLAQVDETFTIIDFNCNLDFKNRRATVSFYAQNSKGEQVGGEYTWA